MPTSALLLSMTVLSTNEMSTLVSIGLLTYVKRLCAVNTLNKESKQ